MFNAFPPSLRKNAQLSSTTGGQWASQIWHMLTEHTTATASATPSPWEPLLQCQHVCPRSRSPHTYIFNGQGSGKPAAEHELQLNSQGGGNFWRLGDTEDGLWVTTINVRNDQRHKTGGHDWVQGKKFQRVVKFGADGDAWRRSAAGPPALAVARLGGQGIWGVHGRTLVCRPSVERSARCSVDSRQGPQAAAVRTRGAPARVLSVDSSGGVECGGRGVECGGRPSRADGGAVGGAGPRAGRGGGGLGRRTSSVWVCGQPPPGSSPSAARAGAVRKRSLVW